LALEHFHGLVPPPRFPSVFAAVLEQNVSWRVSRLRRRAVWAQFAETIGVTPDDVLEAGPDAIERAIQGGGLRPDLRAARLIHAARSCRVDFGGDLDWVVALPLAGVRAALTSFPGVEVAAADWILALCGGWSIAALGPPAARLVTRLGLVENGAVPSYEQLQQAVHDQIPNSSGRLRATTLLDIHGSTVCTSASPGCDLCVLRRLCPTGAALRVAARQRGSP